jgi:transmembrane 9 superfamily protein 2/4
LVFLVLVIACSEITIVLVYMQLCSESYNWWWQSMLMSGGVAIYVFLYSIYYFARKLHIDDVVASMLYFGYSALMSFGFFLLTGAIGFSASFWFIRKIYGAIKIE